MSYKIHLSKDRKLRALIESIEVQKVERKRNICLHICGSIISQQLSTKVAAVIYERFLNLFHSQSPKPNEILSISLEQLRAVGLSASKANYIRNVCQFFIENKITDTDLYKMESKDLIELLTQIKGVGRWTVEMLMIFSLAHEDVFSTGDLGLQKSMIRLYDLPIDNPKNLEKEMLKISEKWSPYRSYACKYLWRYLDTP